MKEKAKSLIAQGAAMKEIIACAMNLTNAVFTVNSQKIMRKEKISFEAELQAFKQVTNNLKPNFSDSELLEFAAEITKQLISPEIAALNRKN